MMIAMRPSAVLTGTVPPVGSSTSPQPNPAVPATSDISGRLTTATTA